MFGDRPISKQHSTHGNYWCTDNSVWPWSCTCRDGPKWGVGYISATPTPHNWALPLLAPSSWLIKQTFLSWEGLTLTRSYPISPKLKGRSNRGEGSHFRGTGNFSKAVFLVLCHFYICGWEKQRSPFIPFTKVLSIRHLCKSVNPDVFIKNQKVIFFLTKQ